MVKGGNTEEYVVMGLAVVVIFHLTCMHQCFVGVQNRLGGAGGAGGEIQSGIIFRGQFDIRRCEPVCSQMNWLNEQAQSGQSFPAPYISTISQIGIIPL